MLDVFPDFQKNYLPVSPEITVTICVCFSYSLLSVRLCSYIEIALFGVSVARVTKCLLFITPWGQPLNNLRIILITYSTWKSFFKLGFFNLSFSKPTGSCLLEVMSPIIGKKNISRMLLIFYLFFLIGVCLGNIGVCIYHYPIQWAF